MSNRYLKSYLIMNIIKHTSKGEKKMNTNTDSKPGKFLYGSSGQLLESFIPWQNILVNGNGVNRLTYWYLGKITDGLLGIYWTGTTFWCWNLNFRTINNMNMMYLQFPYFRVQRLIPDLAVLPNFGFIYTQHSKSILIDTAQLPKRYSPL